MGAATFENDPVLGSIAFGETSFMVSTMFERWSNAPGVGKGDSF